MLRKIPGPFTGKNIVNNMEITTIKQNMDKLLDLDFMTKLFNDRLVEFYPNFKEIKNIDFHTYKKHTGKTSMIVVVEYVLTYFGLDGQTAKISLFASAHSDGSRVKAFYGQNYLYQHGFDHGVFLVGRPLFYLPEQYAFFYKAVLGRTLRKLIKEDANLDFAKVLDLSASWIKKLHSSTLENDHQFRQFNVREMSPKPQRFLDDLTKTIPEQGSKLQAIYERLCDLQEKNKEFYQSKLIHGDYHPENIIFKSTEADKIKVIDFTDLAIGDPMVDVGSFIQQFDFMCFSFLERKKINQYKILFLEKYFDEKFENIDIKFLNRINFFQAWVVMRTTLLLFYAKSAKHPLGELIVEIDRYLGLAESGERKINLY